MTLILPSLLLASLLSACAAAAAAAAVAADLVSVEGHAFKYGLEGGMLEGATVSFLGDPARGSVRTAADGSFAVRAAAGENVTLVLSKKGYTTVQSATVLVPPGGLSGVNSEVTFQVPSDLSFDLFELATGSRLHKGMCHMVVTVCAFNETLHNSPQGFPGAAVTLDPPSEGSKAFYFGIWRNLTNPFARGLNATSRDGGVLIANVRPLPAAGGAYTVRAAVPGGGGPGFSTTTLVCSKGGAQTGPRYLINGSPPHGPNALAPRPPP